MTIRPQQQILRLEVSARCKHQQATNKNRPKTIIRLKGTQFAVSKVDCHAVTHDITVITMENNDILTDAALNPLVGMITLLYRICTAMEARVTCG